ncbi:hypothetical protein ACWOB5_07055 [Gemelliphila palaticanis]
MTRICYEDEEASSENHSDKIPTYSIIEIDAPDRERVLNDLLEIIDEIGIPFGSKVYNEEISVDVGTLSKIEVSYTFDSHKNIKKKADKLEDKLSFDYLDELCVVSHSYIFDNEVKYFIYVVDVDMALHIIEDFFEIQNEISHFDIKVSPSGYGIAHRYFSLLRKKYKEEDSKLWDSVKDIYQGASEEDIHTLLKEYPSIPESLIELLKIIDGTLDTRHENRLINFPMFTTEEAGIPLNLLSAKQIISNKELSKKPIINRITNLGVEIDEFISNDIENINVLPLAYCESKYGICELYIDFNPSSKGNYGQLIVYVENLNSYLTISKSFDEFLLDILNNDFYDMFETIDKKEGSNTYDETEEFENVEYTTEGIFWEFHTKEYEDVKVFNKDLKAYMNSMDEIVTLSELKKIVLKEREVLISYEAWIDDIAKLKENEVIDLEEGEELLEEYKEEGLWQVNIFALLKSDTRTGFKLGELMMKVHNQLSNKWLGDHINFEGFEYLGSKTEVGSLIQNEKGLPVFEVIVGS